MTTTPAPPGLDDDAVARAVRDERLRLADLVAGLSPEQWATPSLCSAWTVRHVIAHLTTTTRTSLPQVVGRAVRARGSFDRMEEQVADRVASRHSPAELVAMLRESAGSRRRTPFSAPMDPLMDLVVHQQDVARPLGVTCAAPSAVVAASLAYVATNRFLGAPRRLAGVRLVSADTGWTLGDGADLSGPDLDLLLVASGRPAGLAALSGPGVEMVAERL